MTIPLTPVFVVTVESGASTQHNRGLSHKTVKETGQPEGDLPEQKGRTN